MRSTTRAVVLLSAVALLGGDVWAQTPQQGQAPAGARAQRPAVRGGRAASGELNVQAVQRLVDAWALVQAEKELELSNEQYPNFVTRMTRLQNARRRHMMERQRLFLELRPLVFGTGPRQDDVIAEKVKAVDDLNQRAAQEVRQLGLDVDGVLSPYQRARFRFFEEQIERQKLDMLIRVRQGRGGAPSR